MKLFQLIALGSALTAGLVMAQAPSVPATAQTAAKTAKAAKTPANPPPSASDIADAKSKNLVWVNLNTKKYHKSDASTYGTTKNGKFMTEDEAKAGGNVAAKEPGTKAKKTAAAAKQ